MSEIRQNSEDTYSARFNGYETRLVVDEDTAMITSAELESGHRQTIYVSRDQMRIIREILNKAEI